MRTSAIVDSVVTPSVQRWAAFSSDPAGGNPAGVVLDADGMSDAEMLRVAAEVGYSETAFVTRGTRGDLSLRYFSPLAEVPFCGHATVATAAALAEVAGPGAYSFATPVGLIQITVDATDADRVVRFTSVDPSVEDLAVDTRARILEVLHLEDADLDPAHAPALASAGNPHPLLVVRSRGALDRVTFDPAAARALMDAEGWPATIIVAWAETADTWHVRNVFPVGAISEDPATGAGAAALGGYLRETRAVTPPQRIRIFQGSHVARPSELTVDIPAAGGIVVSGSAVRLPEPATLA
ncbi:PhzF family phenazine biosynthesis protein [Microbacterium sp. ET2]|uniref:PhzF family phenazine biosynthesis protein n=1 Tax=Microbacterium albipurpureum TaxID=3050384 RepID=UPI00259D260F|nr:PhzF family phenazine biosynthesis protein [Microbacterium sp. ET2 (Ac-2212)]WJL96912.1 PhzF family phenazine biosynthesis protein [Microbacterium sp. ET2 (Ac-2212)]